jgi:crotonobetainyl-CoA:carnitine CoA-transferase CaiB-like acyl-CoA transferase
MANVYAALESGATSIETSFAGLGGCPFTKLPSGNVATEDLVHALWRSGERRDIDLAALVDVARDVAATLGRTLPGRVYQAGPLPYAEPTDGGAPVSKKRRILEGTRVLDLTNVLSGPFASLHLALLGAEVIKLENPKEGDLARKLGIVPAYNRLLMGTSFLAQNCNKKSVTLNLKSERGKELFKALVRDADVVIENFRPGVMNRLGLGYELLRGLNPRLVYCAISGFGQTGPDADKPAYDQIIQGLSGEMAINGDERLSPLRAGFPVCDTVGGLNAAFAVMAALHHRAQSGEGQLVDVALLDSIMPLMGWVAANLLIGGKEPALMGNDNFTAAPSGTFRTQDGHVNIAANKQEQWEAVCDVLELPELKADPRFQERDTRKHNRKALTPLLEARLRERPTQHWVDALNARDVPSGAILSLEQALRQPQVVHRGVLQKVNVPELGDIEVFGLTAQFERTAAPVTTPPPKLGQHTAEVLGRLGLSEGELVELRQQGVI